MVIELWGERCLQRFERIQLADSFSTRLLGLMGKSLPLPYEGLLLEGASCSSIHTFFMRFPIDALFFDRDGKLLKLYQNLVPWRQSSIHWSAKSVLELPAGDFSHLDQVTHMRRTDV